MYAHCTRALSRAKKGQQKVKNLKKQQGFAPLGVINLLAWVMAAGQLTTAQ